MRQRFQFTRRKFLSLPGVQQHKKCAELVREMYVSLIGNSEWSLKDLLTSYNELQEWMKGRFLENVDFEGVADRYHDHLRRAKLSLKEHHLLPDVRCGDRKSSMPLLKTSVYLDHLRSAHNVGSIIRTTEAFALGCLYFSPETPFVDHKQVQDAAMGSHQWVKCDQITDLSVLPRPLIALETSEQATSVDDFVFPESFTIAVGNEEYGCSHRLLSRADDIVEIPLCGRKNSLNVANAFAVVAAAIRRQHYLRSGAYE